MSTQRTSVSPLPWWRLKSTIERRIKLNVFVVAFLVIVAIFVLIPIIVTGFLRNVQAGEIRLVSWMGGSPKIYRGPCKATIVPLLTVSSVIPAQAINVDIDITDQTADLDA